MCRKREGVKGVGRSIGGRRLSGSTEVAKQVKQVLKLLKIAEKRADQAADQANEAFLVIKFLRLMLLGTPHREAMDMVLGPSRDGEGKRTTPT